MTFEASAVGNVTVLVFGEALQSFTVNFVEGTYNKLRLDNPVITG